MDSIIGLDFKNELPIIITKTIASTVTKAVAAYATNQAARSKATLPDCSRKSAPPFIKPP